MREIRLTVVCLLVWLAGPADAGEAPVLPGEGVERGYGETLDPGRTGFDVKRPVLASACPHGCPWGELGEFLRDAMAGYGYDVVLCRNCNRTRGPGLVSRGGMPPPLDRVDRIVGTTQLIQAPVDFGITATDNLAYAYHGTHRFADEGPYRNLRLIARIEDPRYLMVAVQADSGITDLAQIRERRLGVRILADERRPAVKAILDHYGLRREQVEAWGGSFDRPSILNTGAEFDVIIDTNASPANNPEAAYWSAYTWRHDLRFLQLPEALLTRLLAEDTALEPVTAKWGLLRGVDRDIRTVMRNGHAVFARADMPDDAAYDAAKAVYERRGRLSFFIRPYAYDSGRVYANYGVPLHPGAEKFYRDVGFLRTPDCAPELTRLPAADEADVYRPRGWEGAGSGQLEAEYVFTCTALGKRYTTTLNVVRPQDPAAFSGVIVVEPTHPGNLWPVRSTTADYLAAAGHAAVAVNSSAIVVERLVKPANPSRYESLTVPERDKVESEILHQVAGAIAGGGLQLAEAPKVILAGYSNTGARVRRYIDYFRGRYDDVFDGYLVGQTAVGTRPGPLPNLDVPVIDLEGEREIIATFERNPEGLTYRRPDTELFRLYEVPGMAHLDTSDPGRLSFPPATCGIERVSSFPLRHVWANTLHRLADWVANGRPAPHAPPIELTDDGSEIRRDEHGNALGGVPVPQLAVPVATMLTHTGHDAAEPRARCDMIGPEIPFDAEKLAALHGNHAAYLAALEQSLDRLIAAGWYLPLYREEVLERARQRATWFE